MHASNKRLIYIGFAFRHHKGTQAGYHHIKEYLKYDKIIDCQWEWDWMTLSTQSKFLKIVKALYFKIFRIGFFWSLIKCIYLAIFCKNQIFHFIYAENTYKTLHHIVGKTNKIVCTYHQPMEIIDKHQEWVNDIIDVDKVILMSQKDINWTRLLTGKDNVYFIPHGINTDFFNPDQNIIRDRNILMVGNWLRDFKFANSVFEFLLEEFVDIIITVVTDDINHAFFKLNKRLNLLKGISDEHLREFYRKSCCLFLPLSSFTANNSILEAAATGCPIVVATDYVDESYFTDKQIDILPLEKEVVCNHIKNMINSKYDESKMNEIRRFVIDNYSWNVVSEKTKAVLLS